MNIAVLGSGAMGSLFAGYLSERNNVYLIGHNKEKQKILDEKGIVIREKNGSEACYHPHVVSSCIGLPIMDLIIVFVRVMDTIEALETNKALIGPNTIILTLQNGAGNDEKLLQYVDCDHAVIGSTQHGSSVLELGKIFHSGTGKTSIGFVNEAITNRWIADELSACGFPCQMSPSVRKQIWEKLFINTAASSLTAVMQVPLGFILDNSYAYSLMLKMVHEAVEVANAEGFAHFDENRIVDSVKEVITNGKEGYTSIYTHIKTGQRSEVDYISGYVVKRARVHGIDVPCHETVVALVHALEEKNRNLYV